MDAFLGGLGLQNKTLPGTVRSTFGSRFQPLFWVPLYAEPAVRRPFSMLQDEGMSDDDPPPPLPSDDSEK